jgi:hypothetical protein
MSLEIREEPLSALAEHATIPIVFRVERVLYVSAGGTPDLLLAPQTPRA